MAMTHVTRRDNYVTKKHHKLQLHIPMFVLLLFCSLERLVCGNLRVLLTMRMIASGQYGISAQHFFVGKIREIQLGVSQCDIDATPYPTCYRSAHLSRRKTLLPGGSRQPRFCVANAFVILEKKQLALRSSRLYCTPSFAQTRNPI